MAKRRKREVDPVPSELVAVPVSEPVQSVELEAVPAVPVAAGGRDLLGDPIELPRKVWTSPELATVAGVSPSRVRQLCIDGRLPGAFKLGRDWLVPDEAVQVWLKHDRDRRRTAAAKDLGAGI